MLAAWARRRGEQTHKDNQLWLIVLCDLMTNLMLFFLVMYAYTLQSPEKRRQMAEVFDAPAQAEDPRQARATEMLRQHHEIEAPVAIKELLLRSGLVAAEISVTETAIRLSLREQLVFDTGRASLADPAPATLKILAGVLKDMPNDVVIEGHTDDVAIAGGPYRTNWELSVARSYSVIERLIQEGVAPRRLAASGYGEYHPIGPNDSHEGRRRNRRVEILILRGAPHE